MDVRSVVEAVSAEDSDAPVYEVESLCMRCGENVSTPLLTLGISSSCTLLCQEMSFFLSYLSIVKLCELILHYWGYWGCYAVHAS